VVSDRGGHPAWVATTCAMSVARVATGVAAQ
jgi:hypothetical protein